MSKLHQMMGTKEVLEQVEGIKTGLPALRNEIITQVVAELKPEFVNMVQAIELRMKQSMTNLAVELKESNNPTSVVYAIEKREDEIKKDSHREEIMKSLAVIYARSREVSLFEKSERGRDKFSEEGEKLYRMLGSTVLEIAKYHGSGSHSKVANPTTYESFEKESGIKRPLAKRNMLMYGGSNRESVYIDIMQRGIVDKFAQFLETRFMAS